MNQDDIMVSNRAKCTLVAYLKSLSIFYYIDHTTIYYGSIMKDRLFSLSIDYNDISQKGQVVPHIWPLSR